MRSESYLQQFHTKGSPYPCSHAFQAEGSQSRAMTAQRRAPEGKAEIRTAEVLYKQVMICFCTLVEVRSSPLLKTYSTLLYSCWNIMHYHAGFPYDSVLGRCGCNQAQKLFGPVGC